MSERVQPGYGQVPLTKPASYRKKLGYPGGGLGDSAHDVMTAICTVGVVGAVVDVGGRDTVRECVRRKMRSERGMGNTGKRKVVSETTCAADRFPSIGSHKKEILSQGRRGQHGKLGGWSLLLKGVREARARWPHGGQREDYRGQPEPESYTFYERLVDVIGMSGC